MFGKKFLLALALGIFLTHSPQVKANVCGDCPTESATIDRQELVCGDQEMVFTGSATYVFTHDRRLIVKLDGTEIYAPSYQPNPWSTPATLVGIGNHVLTAEIYSDIALRAIGSTDEWEFEILECKETKPSPEPIQEIGLGVNGPDCGNSFHTELKIKVDGVGQKDITVKFSYKAEEKTATTNSDGIAGVDFEFKGNGEITARSEGYPNQTIGVEAKKDCPAGGAGEVLGASTTGQVLGAMADTGTAIEDLFLMMFTLGSSLVATGLKLYAKKN